MKTFSMTTAAAAKDKKWILIDADGVVLGRLASIVALRLKGKHKPGFTPHMDCGDYIVVVNAAKVRLTGKKLADRRFHWHTGHPGGIGTIHAGNLSGFLSADLSAVDTDFTLDVGSGGSLVYGGAGGDTPRPRKLRPETSMMLSTKSDIEKTIDELMTLGSAWRKMMRPRARS